MRYYETDNNTTGKRAGAAAVIVYAAALLIVFLVVRVGMERKLSDEGILIDFGTTIDGVGTQKTTLAETTVTTPPTPSTGDIATQDIEEAPEVVQERPEDRHQQTDRTVNQRETVAQQPVEERPREVNQRALFPGRNDEPGTESHGSGAESGNQGNPAGGNEGVSDGTGTGDEGHSFDLEGRDLAESLPRPAIPSRNESGRVVIEITVDNNGAVTNALYLARGSTTQDDELVRLAIDAAKKAKFTPDDKNPLQAGTITYIFKLN